MLGKERCGVALDDVGGHADRVVGASGDPGQRVDEDQRVGSFGVGRRELDRHQSTLGFPDDGCLFRPGRGHDRNQVLDPEIGPGELAARDGIGHAGTEFVENDHP